MPDPLHLLSFNILEGLRPVAPVAPVEPEHRQIDRGRADAARAVVAAVQPDILVLNEALFCRQFADRVVDYGELFSYPYQTAALYDDAWGNAVLSRHPITSSREMRIYNRGGLVAAIATPQGTVTVASYHPHPGRQPENKARDFTRLVADVDGPLIVCGDMNCISPHDELDRAGLIEGFKRFSQNPDAAVDQFIDSGKSVFGALEAIGLEDAVPVAGRRYTIPTDLISLDKSSAMRIDHVFANAAVEVTGGGIIHSADSNRASDHHPAHLEFHIRAD